jgi:predicted RND superfamily exporter protein
VARPALVLLVAALTVPPAAWVARGLELRTGFDELLPENMPSVVELRRIGDRLPSVSVLAVTAECRDTIALLFSINGAVRSLGLTAALGELATQFSAMLVLPAFLYWISGSFEGRPKSCVTSRR